MAATCRRLIAAAPKYYRFLHRSPCLTTDSLSKYQSQSQMFANIQRNFSSEMPLAASDKVTLNFVLAEGEKHSVQAKLGENLLDVIIDNDIDIDGFGACEGTLACSTCHLIFKPADYEKIPEKPSDEELDMLDLAFGLQDTSRLGCQIIVSKDMEGWEITVPESVADAREP